MKWRRGRDSNPRDAVNVYAISSRAPSTTRTPLREGENLEARISRSRSSGRQDPKPQGRQSQNQNHPGWDGRLRRHPAARRGASGHPRSDETGLRPSGCRSRELRRASSPSLPDRHPAPLRGVSSERGWRRGWDSNPRYAVNVYRFSRPAPSTTRPPLQLEGGENRTPRAGFQPLRGTSAEARRARKKSRSSEPHSSARTPRTISTRWLRRGSSGRLARLPLMPALGSSAP